MNYFYKATFFAIIRKKPNIRFHLYKALSTQIVSKELFISIIISCGQFATQPFISELVLPYKNADFVVNDVKNNEIKKKKKKKNPTPSFSSLHI